MFFCFLMCLIFFQCWDLNWGPTPWATPPALFCDRFFWDKVLWTICPGCLQTVILLISASWVARITGVSHQCLASKIHLKVYHFNYFKCTICATISINFRTFSSSHEKVSLTKQSVFNPLFPQTPVTLVYFLSRFFLVWIFIEVEPYNT
jgi:hypothetical protein